MKIEGHGQAKILTQEEIELLFNDGLQSDRDRTLFGVCLYTACGIAEACSLMVKDTYTNTGTVRSTINFRKANTKGKLQTRTIPVIEDLRSLLTSWRPHAGQTYLFPGRHRCHHWRHLHPDSADRILRETFQRAGIEGASTHRFRRTALTQMSNAGIALRVIQEISGHSNLEQLQRYLEVKPEQVRGAKLVKIFRVAAERFRLKSGNYEPVIMVVCGLIRWRIGVIVICQEKSIETGKNSKNNVIKIGSYD